jgi:hypothetical protein
MMSAEVIRSIARDAANKAKRSGRVPFHPECTEDIRAPFPFPFLGDYVPKGWKAFEDEKGEYQDWFCDSSGFGSPNEPALTVANAVREFQKWFETHPTAGFAVVEAGQFQVYVRAYEYVGVTKSGRTSRRKTNGPPRVYKCSQCLQRRCSAPKSICDVCKESIRLHGLGIATEDETEKCACVYTANARRATACESVELVDPGCTVCKGTGLRPQK